MCNPYDMANYDWVLRQPPDHTAKTGSHGKNQVTRDKSGTKRDLQEPYGDPGYGVTVHIVYMVNMSNIVYMVGMIVNMINKINVFNLQHHCQHLQRSKCDLLGWQREPRRLKEAPKIIVKIFVGLTFAKLDTNLRAQP